MAKVLAPLFSSRAEGQIGKSIVFFPWKGISAVRSYLIPANPRTAAQQAQRGLLADAVNTWHATGLTDADRTAYDVFASVQATPMTGFNVFVRRYIACRRSGQTWVGLFDGRVTSTVPGEMELRCKGPAGKVVKARYGTSKTFMPNVVDLRWDPNSGDYWVVLSGLGSGVKYFVQFFAPGVGVDVGILGIYSCVVS